MAWTLVQAGALLYGVSTDGTVTALTMPSDVTIDTTKQLRAAPLGRSIVLVNAPTRNIVVDADGTVRPLVPLPPPEITAANGALATLPVGWYAMRASYGIKNSAGVLLAESPLSNISVGHVTGGSILFTCAASLDASVNCLRIYRSTMGATLAAALLKPSFQYADIDGVPASGYTFDSNIPDASLALLPTLPSTLGVPPGTAPGTRMRLIASWKDRLWGVSDDPSEQDDLRYTANGQAWAWSPANDFPIPVVGSTPEGITAIMARRDDLGVFKRDSAHKIIGDSDATFQRITMTDKAGLVAPDAALVIDNIGYGLGADGVYQYDDRGFRCITRDDVDAWFTTDTYFNRARFQYAKAKWDADLNTYEIHLSAAGSTALDRWISLDLVKMKWLGPHKTAAFTPYSAGTTLNASSAPIAIVGGDDGYLYTADNAARTDKTATAIDLDIRTVHPTAIPDIDKVFLQPDVLTKVESGGTLTITPTVGGMDAVAQVAFTVDLTLGRQRCVYLGPGRILQLQFQENTNARDVTIYGFELPWFALGRK